MKKKRNPNDATFKNINALKKRVAKLESLARAQSVINDGVELYLRMIKDYLSRGKNGKR